MTIFKAVLDNWRKRLSGKKHAFNRLPLVELWTGRSQKLEDVCVFANLGCNFWEPILSYCEIIFQAPLFASVSAPVQGRVVNGPHFEARNRREPEITSPNATFIFGPDLGPKAKFTEWVKICATMVCQKGNVRV